jgi:hypothetical protein
MRTGAIFSGTLHTVVFVLLVFGLPRLSDRPTDTVIPVEVVMLEEEAPPEPEPEPEPEPKAEEPAPEPEPPVQEAKAAPEPPPPPEPEPEPAPPEPEAMPEPEPPAPPPPQAKPEPEAPKTPPPPVPRRRPEIKMAAPEKPKEEKKKPDRLASILRNVDDLKDKPQPRRTQIAKADTQGAPAGPPVSALERDEMVRKIQQKLRQCWRIDAGAAQAQDLIVEIRVQLQPDGSVRRADILDVVRMVRDAYFRSAAENARRAVFKCSPFQLPPRKYNVWRDLTLRFNPREMFGS